MTLAPLDHDAPLAYDLLCVHCKYNLRTKRPSEKCPECGQPVAHTIEKGKQLAGARLLNITCGSLLIALQPMLALLVTYLYDYLWGRPPYIADLVYYFGLVLMSGIILLSTILFTLRPRTSPHRFSKWSSYTCIALALLNLLIPTYYIAISYYDYYHPFTNAHANHINYVVGHFHGLNYGSLDPSAPYWRWGWMLYTFESAITLALTMAARIFMLRFATRHSCARLAFITRICLTIACLLAFFQCFQRTMVLTFAFGEYTIAPLVLAATEGLPDIAHQVLDFTFGTIQVLYWTGVAILAWRLHRLRRHLVRANPKIVTKD